MAPNGEPFPLPPQPPQRTADAFDMLRVQAAGIREENHRLVRQNSELKDRLSVTEAALFNLRGELEALRCK